MRITERNRSSLFTPYGLFCLVILGVCIWEIFTHAWYFSYSSFVPIDDEGYSMIGIKMFNEGHVLYDQIFSTFGPFFYAYYHVLLGLTRLPVTHDVIRFFTVAHWILTAIVCGLVAGRLTKSPLVFAAAFLATSIHLNALAPDPGHPQGLCVLLTALIILAATGAEPIGRWPLCAAGLLAGMLILCKINIGIFSLAPLLFALVVYTKPAWPRTVALFVLGLALAALPAALMAKRLPASSATFIYCATATLAILPVLVFGWRIRPATFLGFRKLGLFAACLLVGAVLPIAAVRVHGTSWKGLLDGILVRPFSMGDLFFVPIQISGLAVVAVIFSISLAAACIFARRDTRIHRAAHQVRDVLRLALPPALLFFVLRFDTEIIMACFVPFAWLVLDDGLPAPSFGRLILAGTAAVQSLAAFPVAGVQRSWATFLLVPLFAIFFYDGIQDLVSRKTLSWLAAPKTRRILAGACMVALAAAYYFVAGIPQDQHRYQSNIPSGLPGAEHIRLTPDATASLNWAVNNLRAHADCVISLPGLYSFNFWHGTDPPTGYNASNWVLLLNDGEERAIIDAVASKERVCVIANLNAAAFWAANQSVSVEQRPLVKYILQNFNTSFERAPYSLFVPRNTPPALLYESLLCDERTFKSGADYLPLPKGVFGANKPFTLALAFKTTESGVILGLDNGGIGRLAAWAPLVYVDRDGKLRLPVDAHPSHTIALDEPVNDGRWHRLILAAKNNGLSIFLDGRKVRDVQVNLDLAGLNNARVATGFAKDWPKAGTGWSPFRGTLRDIILYHRPLPENESLALFQQAFFKE